VLQLNTEDDGDAGGSQGSDAPMNPRTVTGSYTNLFDTREDVPLGGSAHSLRTINTLGRTAGPPTDYTTAAAQRPSPVAGKKRSADVRAPMAQQDEFSPTSPAAVVTTPAYHAPSAMPQYIHSPQAARSMSLASDAKYPTTQALITDTLGPSPPHAATQPRRTTTARPPGPGAARQVYGPPLGVQQQNRPGVRTYNTLPPHYPGAAPAHRYPLPPKESGYSSSSGTSKSADSTATNTVGAVAAENKQALSDIPGAIRRPMSFVKALEMSDQLQMQERERERNRQRQKRQSTPPERISEEEEQHHHQQHQPQQQQQQQQQHYGSTYEISV
jgi:hypothetical protein